MCRRLYPFSVAFFEAEIIPIIEIEKENGAPFEGGPLSLFLKRSLCVTTQCCVA